MDVILPSLETLIFGNNVNNLAFIDLVFKNTSWLGPSNYNTSLDSNNGLCIVQADWYYDIQNLTTTNGNIISSAIKFINSNQVNFYNNIFKNIGSIGLQFLQNCSNNTICNNTFSQICASAITFGYSDYVNSDSSNNNLIENNLIDTIGTEYKSSVAILIISAKNTIVKNNEIANFPYTGISLGWGWGDGWCLPTTNCYNFGKNQILRNKIDCSGQKMNDGGAIYFLDSQGIDDNIINYTEVKENYIINYKMSSGAIYCDKGSRRINVTNNLIESIGILTPSEGFVNFTGDFFWFTVSFEQAENISFSGNYFSSNNYQMGALPASDPTIIESNNTPITVDNIQTLLIKNNAVRNLNCN